MSRGFNLEHAHAVLQRCDPLLHRWIQRVPVVVADPRWRLRFDVVDALARAILYQQLSGKAAATIVGRVVLAVQSEVLTASALACVNDDVLRACGVSAAKTRALRDLVAHAERGEIPSLRSMARLGDEAIIERLTRVRGIGRWTVEMLLMFRLGRPDVLPVDDLGLRKGMQRVDGLAQMPTSREFRILGQRWAPYRTLASLYLWRIADTPLP